MNAKHCIVIGCVAIAVAANTSGQTISECNQTQHFLRQLQHADGGYTVDPPTAKVRGLPSLRATSGVVRALPKFRGKPRDGAADAVFVDKCFVPTSGGFAERPGGLPDVFFTAVGLLAVVELKMPLEKYRDPALQYLNKNAKSLDEIRIAAAALEALKADSPQAGEWLKLIEAQRNADGTYGKGGEIPATTAAMATTVLRLGGTLANREEVVRVLKDGQCKDGGYGITTTGNSDLESSYRVMRALVLLNEKPRKPEDLKMFIGMCRHKNGGYGLKVGDNPNASGTYYAGFLLNWLDKK